MAYMDGQKHVGRDVFVETDYRDFIHERAVRTADGWDYILNLVSGGEELYNLKKDPGEKDNLINTETSKAEFLRQELRTHLLSDLHENLGSPPSVGCLPVYNGECQ